MDNHLIELKEKYDSAIESGKHKQGLLLATDMMYQVTLSGSSQIDDYVDALSTYRDAIHRNGFELTAKHLLEFVPRDGYELVLGVSQRKSQEICEKEGIFDENTKLLANLMRLNYRNESKEEWGDDVLYNLFYATCVVLNNERKLDDNVIDFMDYLVDYHDAMENHYYKIGDFEMMDKHQEWKESILNPEQEESVPYTAEEARDDVIKELFETPKKDDIRNVEVTETKDSFVVDEWYSHDGKKPGEKTGLDNVMDESGVKNRLPTLDLILCLNITSSSTNISVDEGVQSYANDVSKYPNSKYDEKSMVLKGMEKLGDELVDKHQGLVNEMREKLKEIDGLTNKGPVQHKDTLYLNKDGSISKISLEDLAKDIKKDLDFYAEQNGESGFITLARKVEEDQKEEFDELTRAMYAAIADELEQSEPGIYHENLCKIAGIGAETILQEIMADHFKGKDNIRYTQHATILNKLDGNKDEIELKRLQKRRESGESDAI